MKNQEIPQKKIVCLAKKRQKEALVNAHNLAYFWISEEVLKQKTSYF